MESYRLVLHDSISVLNASPSSMAYREAVVPRRDLGSDAYIQRALGRDMHMSNMLSLQQPA